jgi:acetyl-CoA acetyltransferase
MVGMFEGVRIVGAGQTTYEKKSSKSVQRLIYEASAAALADAGLEWNAVDGLAVTCFLLPPDNVATVAEHLGVEARFLFQGLYGGASGVIGMAHAARAIRDGSCDVVVCAAADAFDVAAHNETLDRFNGSVKEYMSPQGFGGANGMFALHTRLYMERHGARREDFGRFCIALRENALLNPNALFKQPLSMDAYLNAKQIADPLRLYDCVMPCVGGDAIVLASERIAASLKGPSVRILSAEEIHNFPANDPYTVPGGWSGLSERLYARAGIRPDQLDFAQLYDDYPVMAFVQLEGLGLCAPGTALRFVRDTDITTKGTLPINTGGGQLSAGQAGASGGMIGLYEGVAQLLGRAGDRQVPGARRGLVSGYGMVAYGRGLCSSAAILERVEPQEGVPC